jgi:ribosome maturation factor RimP
MEALRQIEARLSELSEPWIQEVLPDGFLVELRIRVHRPEPEILVRVDTDRGITLDECVKVHLHLRDKYESLDWLPENYGITVSSPGIGTPLRLRRQYYGQKGRFLAVRQKSGQWVRGRLLDVDDQGILIEGRHHPIAIAWDHIATAHVEVPYSRPNRKTS